MTNIPLFSTHPVLFKLLIYTVAAVIFWLLVAVVRKHSIKKR